MIYKTLKMKTLKIEFPKVALLLLFGTTLINSLSNDDDNISCRKI